MSNDWTTKSLAELVGDYTDDIKKSQEKERAKHEEQDRIARAKAEEKIKAGAEEEVTITGFVSLVAPVFAALQEQMRASGLDARVVTWWRENPTGDRTVTEPATTAMPKGRTCEKLIELIFANHPQDRVRQSRMLFCTGTSTVNPPGVVSEPGARDAFVFYTGVDQDRWSRQSEDRFDRPERMGRVNTELIEWIVKQAFVRLRDDSAKRRDPS
jgi:hypothetical protein